MPNRVVDLLKADREFFLDEFVARVTENIPFYTRLPAPELRASATSFFEDMLRLFEADDRGSYREYLGRLARERVAQGFAAGDLLRALLTALPVVRDHLRSKALERQPEFASDYSAVEDALTEATMVAANLYMDEVTRRIETKNKELNRLNQRLMAHEKLLTAEVDATTRALESANEFNQRVIESLTSGVIAVDAQTRKVSLYSGRAAEILGIESEAALGADVAEAFAALEGLKPEEMVTTVRATGRLPLTKLEITTPLGQRRTVYVRAQRMYDGEGEAEGTVVVVDDVTERELLIDSFSRYVSRDVLQRLLSRGSVELEGERRTCTILFADIRGFSAIAEHATPEEVHEMLNAYFRVMIAAVTDHGGFVDKFVGDKVMAIFAGSTDARVGAVDALRAALEIKAQIESVNQARAANGAPRIDVGIGVNTGDVLLGNVGSDERMNFTAIGDVVNVADRLQHLARDAQVFVGEGTAALTRDRFRLTDRGETGVHGRAAPVRHYELDLERPKL